MMLPADDEWGNRRSNGSFTGMVGDVMDRKADFAACDITVTRTRREAVDFSYGYYFNLCQILTAAPVEVSKVAIHV